MDEIIKKEIQDIIFNAIMSIAHEHGEAPFEFEYYVEEPEEDGPKELGKIDINIESTQRALMINLYNLQVSDYDYLSFIKTVVTAFHEIRHLEQYYEFQTSNDVELLAEYCAKQNNNLFYRDNYLTNLYEIDAERAGIIQTYIYVESNIDKLQQMFGIEINALQTIKDFLENRINERDKRYLGKGFESCKSIENVVKCFNNYYNESKTKEKELCNSVAHSHDLDDDEYKENILCSLIAQYEDQNEVGYIEELFKTTPKGVEQVKLLAALVLKEHPEYKSHFKNSEIKKLDFDAYLEVFKTYRLTTRITDTHEQRRERFLELVKKQANKNRNKDMER